MIKDLDGVTDDSTSIAQAIREGRLDVKFLTDSEFNQLVKERGFIPGNIKALQTENTMLLRARSTHLAFDAVHEGKHYLDDLLGSFPPYDLAANMEAFKIRLQWEKSAYWAEREFMIKKIGEDLTFLIRPHLQNEKTFINHMAGNYTIMIPK